MTHCYIYAYCKPDAKVYTTLDGLTLPGTPLYIGIGTNQRLYTHLKEVMNQSRKPSTNHLKFNAIQEILNAGEMPVIIKLKDDVPRSFALKQEISLIAEIGTIIPVDGVDKRGPLTNLHKGGGGGRTGPLKESTKQKISATRKAKGIKPSDEHLQKFLHAGANRVRSEEENAKRGKAISKAMTPEVTAKRVSTRKANGWVSEEALARREELIASGALKHSEEAKANISSATKEAMSDPSVKEKMKASAKKRWANPEEAKKVSERNSKTYRLVHRETGEVLIVKNLGKYCVENETSHYWVFKEFEVTKIGS